MNTNLPQRFARFRKTKPMTFWMIMEWRENNLPIIDIQARLERRGFKIKYGTLAYWVRKLNREKDTWFE